ncbi:MAG: nitrogen fixation protein NifX [Nitrospirae bacterium]|nr:MAG: nitrogen fixation protein NifX [Nitrospirota bacterium]
MKIGFATTDGIHVDEHFGRAGMFAIYEMTPDSYSFSELRKFADGIDQAVVATRGMRLEHEEKVQDKADKLADCKIICLTEIGAPSAARLVKKGIMPIKVNSIVTIQESLERLLETVRTSPPPWLRKVLNQ